MHQFASIFFVMTFSAAVGAQPDPMEDPGPDMQREPAPAPAVAPVRATPPPPAPAPAAHSDGDMLIDDDGGSAGQDDHDMDNRPNRHGRHHRDEGRRHTRPEGFSVGLGFGWVFPGTDIQVPNFTSARFRLPSGLTIEPAFELSRSSTKNEIGTIETTDDATTLELSALVRFPVMRSRKLGLIAVGGAAIGTSTDDPDGANNATTVTALQIVYGLGVEYWYNAHWNVSATTINPLFSYAKQKMDGVGGDISTSQTSFGLVFEPNVILMLHLFFE